ncbi:MAG: S41 family peptidase [Planctomycetota bacterium]
MVRRFSHPVCCVATIAFCIATVQSFAADGVASASIEAMRSYSEPALSPDRKEIAFVSGGDIWSVPTTGGEARLLVSHPATESRPLFSPDGKRLAFVSTRTGNGDIYLLTLATNELKRITYSDSNDNLDNWSRDGKWLYFSSTSQDIGSMNDVFRVSADGGSPMAVSADRYANEFFSAPSPDGSALAFTARGIASSQWWRKGHSHLDECEIWIRRDGATPLYQQVSDGHAKEMWPMWSSEGNCLYYMSDRSGAQNIWVKPLNGQARTVTNFENGRVLWPRISLDGSTIVFERNFGIWMLDTASGLSREVPVVLRGTAAGPMIEHLNLSNRIQEYALSPDGRKIAFVAHGEIFAVSARDGGDAVRVSRTTATEERPAWSPDSKKIAYVSTRPNTPGIFQFDFLTNTETQLTRDESGDAEPAFSPDGKLLAFERGGKELRVLDLATKQDRVVATGYFDRPPFNSKHPFAWSPDSRWIAYTAPTSKSFRNISVVPAEGGKSEQVSFVANVFSNALAWSPEGTFLLFHSHQRTENGQIVRVDLSPRQTKFKEDPFRELFKDEPPRMIRTFPAQPPTTVPSTTTTPGHEAPKPDAPKEGPFAAPKEIVRPVEVKKQPIKPVEIVFDNIRQRGNVLPAGVDAHGVTIAPDGKSAIIVAGPNGQRNLYTYTLDENGRDTAVAKQLTSTPGNKSEPHFSPDGREVYYLELGRINVIPLDTRTPRTLPINIELDVDFAREKFEVFNQAWTFLRDNFFDEKFNGVDWSAVRTQYAPRIAGARTPDELRRTISLMLGELNASHMGISDKSSGTDSAVGLAGVRFDRAEYEANGRLRITEVIHHGPADSSGIKVGETILAVDGIAISARTNMDALMQYKLNRRVVLIVEAAAKEGTAAAKREVTIRPINSSSEKQLVYRQWVEERRAYVAKASNGRLGYIHMTDMSENSLMQLNVDLDAENHSREGVVVDVRNNNGGFVNAYAIDILARRSYVNMTGRGQRSTTARAVLGQRALESPTILVCNQHSLSDAEDFTEGYRSLKLGKVVGEPTGGWIVFTSSETLIDGSQLRIPFIKVTTSSGEPMEMHPRPVDVEVIRPIGESYTGKDSQLDTAVKELLKQIGQK